MLDRERFIKMVTEVAELFGKELSAYALKLYYEVFKEYSYEDLERAFMQVLKTHKYHTFPAPAEILECMQGNVEDKSLYAWQKVIDAVRNIGYYQSVSFDDPVIHMCIETLGGWMWLCDCTKDQMPWVEKEFLKLYRMFLQYPRKNAARLAGFIEQQNNAHGFLEAIPRAVAIGEIVRDTVKRIECKKEIE